MKNYGQNRSESSQNLIFWGNLAKLYRGIKTHFFSLFFNVVRFSEDFCVISSGYYDKYKSYGQVFMLYQI